MSDLSEQPGAGLTFHLLMYAPDARPNIQYPHRLFDPVLTGEPPTEAMLGEVKQLVETGETVLLSCADRRRRNYAAMLARKMMLRARLH
jgi:hypothetical protein